MSKYDFFVAGRWRNREAIDEAVAALRATGKKVYCFIENEYEIDGSVVDVRSSATEQMQDWQTNPTFRKVFDTDMKALRESDALLLVFPAGLASHIEVGAAYGMGKKVYGVGTPEKPETLYLVFDKIFSDKATLVKEFA